MVVYYVPGDFLNILCTLCHLSSPFTAETESNIWPKCYVGFFRPTQKQLQRLYLAASWGKGELPWNTRQCTSKPRQLSEGSPCSAVLSMQSCVPSPDDFIQRPPYLEPSSGASVETSLLGGPRGEKWTALKTLFSKMTQSFSIPSLSPFLAHGSQVHKTIGVSCLALPQEGGDPQICADSPDSQPMHPCIVANGRVGACVHHLAYISQVSICLNALFWLV